MSKVDVESYYKRQAKDVVDGLFDKRLLHPIAPTAKIGHSIKGENYERTW